VAWAQFANLAAQLDYVADLLQTYDAPTFQSLTGYAYLVEAINALKAYQDHVRLASNISR
jgi:hypothetical protein